MPVKPAQEALGLSLAEPPPQLLTQLWSGLSQVPSTGMLQFTVITLPELLQETSYLPSLSPPSLPPQTEIT